MMRRCKKLADKGAHPSPSSFFSHEAEAPEVGNNARSFRQGEQAAPSFRILPLRARKEKGGEGMGGEEGRARQYKSGIARNRTAETYSGLASVKDMISRRSVPRHAPGNL